jgi:hypothetical protein
MLNKVFCLFALSTFVSFAGYAEEAVTMPEEQMIHEEVVAQPLLAVCVSTEACEAVKTTTTVTEETVVIAETMELADCGCKKKKNGEEGTEELVCEEVQVELAKCCGGCGRPNDKHNDAAIVEDDEEMEEVVQKVA